MNELIQLVVSKTGISEDTAKTAVETVLGFVKSKVPGPIGAQIESALSGGGIAGALGGLGGGDLAKGLGGLFDK